jgi:glycosyltransferase involved in cell wall biosynthesis
LADAIISPTHTAKNDLVKTFAVPEKKIHIIPNWTNLTQKPLPKTSRQYDCVYAGRLVKPKRVEMLIHIIHKARRFKKNISLCILGSGEEESNLRRLIQDYGLQKNIFLQGAVQDISPYIRNAKVFLCASSYGAEGFPLAILEAMASGTTVLTYPFAGANEVIHHKKNGLIARSTQEFVGQLKLLLGNTHLRQSLARKAKRDAVSNYSTENIKRYFEILHLT